MANQDPQPEIYEVISTFDTALTPNTGVAGSQIVTNINTFQANNEVVRVYGIKINVTNNAAVPANLDPATAANCDYSVTIQAGPAQVPSFTFRMMTTILLICFVHAYIVYCIEEIATFLYTATCTCTLYLYHSRY